MSTETTTGRPLAWIPVRNRGTNYEVAVTASLGGLNDREAVTAWCADARPVGAWRPVALIEADQVGQAVTAEPSDVEDLRAYAREQLGLADRAYEAGRKLSIQRERARDIAVALEQDAAEGRRLAAALLLVLKSAGSWGDTQRAIAGLAGWINARDEVAR